MRAIEILCFTYGSVASILSLLFYGYLLITGRVAYSLSLWEIEALFMSYGIVLVITSYQRPSRPLWRPIFTPTSQRARLARWVIGAAMANLGFWCVELELVRFPWGAPGGSVVLSSLFGSFALLNAVYITFHWAYRPENLFPYRILRFAANPLLFLLSPAYRRQPQAHSFSHKRQS
jgi:hypothetical protein